LHNQSLSAIKQTLRLIAGWSSLVARQAHNLKVVGSNPAPATKFRNNKNPGAALVPQQKENKSGLF
jgi:hypothetical protein